MISFKYHRYCRNEHFSLFQISILFTWIPYSQIILTRHGSCPKLKRVFKAELNGSKFWIYCVVNNASLDKSKRRWHNRTQTLLYPTMCTSFLIFLFLNFCSSLQNFQAFLNLSLIKYTKVYLLIHEGHQVPISPFHVWISKRLQLSQNITSSNSLFLKSFLKWFPNNSSLR